MAGENDLQYEPEPISGTSNQLKKSIGRLIIKINSDILEFLVEFRKVKTGLPLSEKGVTLKKAIDDQKNALEDALKGLEIRPSYVRGEKLEKTVQMIKENITTATKVLGDIEIEEITETDVTIAQSLASEAIEEVISMEQQAQEEMRRLTSALSNLANVQEVTEDALDDNAEEAAIKRELASIGVYQADRYNKMKTLIIEKMKYHKDDLQAKWNEQKEMLDYQALKEFRAEFEADHKKMRYMVSEWERRKYSDRLSDLLMDTVDKGFDEYIILFRTMDEEKRLEAAAQRKKSIQMEEYKREKKRAIPSWPQSLSYAKFKPDLLSWDKEHYLSSGSVKFGLLAEMLKSQGRITTYEQIQTRLGKVRNDENIVSQVVSLLDAINEETVYNKLCSAWDGITGLKKEKKQTLNEPEPVKGGKYLAYYEQREKNMARKVELNDKLKAVHLIKALGVDGNHKRDILAKVNFNKEPKEVYEDTKTAIRDICGENDFETVTEDKEDKASEVLVVKPWQEKKNDNSRPDFSRSRSRDNSRQGRTRDRTYRSYSRDRSGSRDRSYSRGRSHRRSSVSFQEKRGGREYRRDTTPGFFTEDVAKPNSAETK